MDSTKRQQLIKQRSVARGMLSRIQTFIKTGGQKIHNIQFRFNKLPDIFTRYDNAQSELELSDDTDHYADRGLLENQFYQVEAKFNELYILLSTHTHLCRVHIIVVCQSTAISRHAHIRVAHT